MQHGGSQTTAVEDHKKMNEKNYYLDKNDTTTTSKNAINPRNC